ncbi:T9SS type A sorting domain-containing protein [Fodinibius sp. Rm-B-1B1-1]|uniref:T9SS type A sorting domain-containing protein n=1 Tax=Fodinibius alkaliphilus TaxID=3140241 RepID=UPI00315AC2F7
MALIPFHLQAQTKTWTGAIDSEWHKAGNWNPSGVPASDATVEIRPQNGNPYPVISKDVTISTVTISLWYSGGDLTVSNGAYLTITNQLNMYSNSNLFIESNSSISITGNINFNGDGSQVIDINGNAQFSTTSDFSLSGTFYGGSGDIQIGGQLTVPSGNSFNTEEATVTVTNNTKINGIYNGDNGYTTFNGNTDVRDGGVINLDTGTIIFNGQAQIRNNGTLNMGTGTVNLNAGLTAESDGNVNVQNGNLNVQGNATFQNNGNLSSDNGNVNVTGDASLQNGGNFNFNEGSLNVGGNSTFQNGGTFNAGKSQIDLKGDLTVQNGGNFNSDSSTVSFSGDQTQTINTNGNDITFHNVKVDSGSSVQTDGSADNTVNIENDLTVEENGQVGVQGDDTIDVQGDLNNQGNVQAKRPFVYAITTPSLSEVIVAYDKKMDPSTTQNTSNYSINNGISVSNATLTPSDSTVTLQVSPQLTENIEYKLTVNNVQSAAGEEISDNHIKRFTPMVDITYYSRQTGSWDNLNSWSTQSHTGSAASSIPNAHDGEDVIIGNNHTITIGSTQDISNLNELTIDDTGTLAVSAGDTLILNEFPIIGGGTFDLQNNGTLQLGLSEGITAPGNEAGNIQSENRSYSETANYIYAGSTDQKTGSGLPVTVNDLRIDNNSEVTASNDLQVKGTLYLQNGTLTIPSGQALIANTKSINNGNLSFERILSGDPGWRMLSSPVSASFNNFLSNIITQGYEGAYYDASVAPNDTLQPNVLYYNETYEGTDNQRWRTPSSASEEVIPGLGYNVYLFGNVEVDERYNNPLPATLTVSGQEHAGPVDLAVTYTAEADTGWNLVGNPYGAPVNWDNSGGWNKTNIDQTIYVWEPDDNSYKTWNGSTGTLGNGIIPPFQAFWIKANTPQPNSQPELVVNENAKTMDSSFYFVGKTRSDTNPEIKIHLNYNNNTNSIFFSFYDNAKVGKDARDAYHLQPPLGTSTYSELFSIGRKNNRFNINALPISFGVPIEIPITANVIKNHQKVSESVELQIAEIKNIPSSWEVTLVDRKTGQDLSTSKGSNYQFKTTGNNNGNEKNKNALQKDYQILTEADPSDARFALQIHPGASGTGLPNKIDLKQNYPNPFNPTTTIRFTLPIQNEVTLEVFNILGRKVATLLDNRSYQAGLHSISWNASNVASGTYIYRLTTGDRVISQKMTVIK